MRLAWRGIYKKIHNVETFTRFRVANAAKSDPKGFFKLCRLKTREIIRSLKTNTGTKENGDIIYKRLNDHFLSENP